jgi:hypothetical protein
MAPGRRHSGGSHVSKTSSGGSGGRRPSSASAAAAVMGGGKPQGAGSAQRPGSTQRPRSAQRWTQRSAPDLRGAGVYHTPAPAPAMMCSSSVVGSVRSWASMPSEAPSSRRQRPAAGRGDRPSTTLPVVEYLVLAKACVRSEVDLGSERLGYLHKGQIVAVTQSVGGRLHCQPLQYTGCARFAVRRVRVRAVPPPRASDWHGSQRTVPRWCGCAEWGRVCVPAGAPSTRRRGHGCWRGSRRRSCRAIVAPPRYRRRASHS